MILPALPGPALLAKMLEPLVRVTDCPAVIVMSPPCACVAVLLTVLALLAKVLPAAIVIEPPAPAPVVEAVMSPPLLSWTLFAPTKIVPPVASDDVPEVLAESVPLFWSVTALAFTKIIPPAPVPCVSVKMPLLVPSISTVCTGLA